MEPEVRCQPGDRIGAYEVVSVLGQGGLGCVYLAKHAHLDRRAALSVPLRKEMADRWYQTANLLSGLDHPNIVKLYDVGEHGGLPYIAMQFVEGETLASLIRGDGPIEIRVLLRIMAAIAGALHHAHEHDVLHKGITPGSIVVSRAGDAVLVGLDIAAPAKGDPLLPDGQVFGTPNYMSPEHFTGACVPQSDIWSLGAVMFRVLTGRTVIQAGHPRQVMETLMSPVPLDLSPLTGKAADYVVEIVERCLGKDLNERFRTADDLKRALEAAIDYGEMSEGETAVLPLPARGQTILTHVEYQESDRPGAFRSYRVGEYLGGGSFGDVFRATEELSGSEVAIKLLKHEHVSNVEAVARFRREATLLSRLRHPNVVRVQNFGRFGSTFFVAMELLGGRTLRDVIQECAPVPVGDAARAMTSALAGLAAIHDAGIVHRDMKPANIAVDGDRVVVFDLGIAHASDLMTLTVPGSFLGTACYASPEQALTRPVTAASDVYAAGVILYELLTGRTPHESDSALGALQKIASEPPVPITEYRTGLPPELVELLDTMLARDPDGRPTASAVSRILAEGVW